MKIPTKINKCPINEAILEIRFTSEIPAEAIFGIIYQKLKDDGYENYTRLPILDFPAEIRENDNNLKYLPHYRLTKDNILVQIGPKVLSVINKKDYLGWEEYRKQIVYILSKIFQLKIIKTITRIGLRYTNLFENIDIFKEMRLKIMLDDKNFDTLTNNLFFIRQNKSILSNLRITNNAILKDTLKKKDYQGSVYDIDTYFEANNIEVKSVFEKIEELHIEEKTNFFTLLKEDFIQSLDPTYGD